MDKNIVKKSKHLSKVLRHDPGSVGVKLDTAGWTDVAKLLTAMKMSREELDEVVATNNKKRFEFDSTGKLIRASQGHSVEVDLGYTPAVPPDQLWHGTSKDAVSAIHRDGILKMNRHHVHLSADKDTAHKVGSRHGKPVVFSVRAGDMAKAGHQFFLSTNGVWLVDYVPPVYIHD